MGFQNFFATRLYADIGASDLSIVLETPPTATSGRLTLEARNPTQREIIRYTGVAGNTITGVTRGVGGTTPKSHTKNSLVEMNAVGEDLQDLWDAWNAFAATNQSGWQATPAVLSFAQGNGGREVVLNTTLDMRNYLGYGSKIKFSRPAGTPTQMLALNGTNQYAHRASASVSGMAFNAAITVEIDVEVPLSHYTTAMIFSRTTAAATDGWYLQHNANGQVSFAFGNAGAVTARMTTSTIPRDRKVKISATCTPATKDIKIYFDGILQSQTSTADAVAAMNNTGNLAVGAWALNPSQYSKGNFGQARIWSTVRTQQQIRDNLGDNLVGNEAGLVFLARLNGDVNDSHANANHLTLVNAPGYVADNPLKPVEMGIVKSVSATQITYDATTAFFGAPSTGALTNFFFSNAQAPVGAPNEIIAPPAGSITGDRIQLVKKYYDANGWLVTDIGGYKTWTKTAVDNPNLGAGAAMLRAALGTAPPEGFANFDDLIVEFSYSISGNAHNWRVTLEQAASGSTYLSVNCMPVSADWKDIRVWYRVTKRT